MKIDRRKVYSWFYKRLEIKADAEDLTQEVMMKLMHREVYTYTYIWTTCRTTLITYLRKKKKQNELHTSIDVSIYIFQRQKIQANEIYNSLPQAVKMRVDGYKYREITHTLDVSARAIANKVHKTREKIDGQSQIQN